MLLVEDTEDRTPVLVQMTFTLLYYVYYRCDHHKILDVSFYDDKHLSVLLVEDTEYCPDDLHPAILCLFQMRSSQDS